MREYNEYVARVAVCEQRAKDARTESEKQSWLVMADSWRETVKHVWHRRKSVLVGDCENLEVSSLDLANQRRNCRGGCWSRRSRRVSMTCTGTPCSSIVLTSSTVIEGRSPNCL
jgi:hypothetical protein